MPTLAKNKVNSPIPPPVESGFAERNFTHLPLHERSLAVNVFWTLTNHVLLPTVCARTSMLPLSDYRYIFLAAQERWVLFPTLKAFALIQVAQTCKIAARMILLPAVRALVV